MHYSAPGSRHRSWVWSRTHPNLRVLKLSKAGYRAPTIMFSIATGATVPSIHSTSQELALRVPRFFCLGLLLGRAPVGVRPFTHGII